MAKKKNLPYDTNPYEATENPPGKAPKPAVTTKTHKSPAGVRGAQKLQTADGERFNRGAVKPWKPKGRK